MGSWWGLPRTPARRARPRCGRDATPPAPVSATPPDTCAPQPPSSKPFASSPPPSGQVQAPGPRCSLGSVGFARRGEGGRRTPRAAAEPHSEAALASGEAGQSCYTPFAAAF